MTSYRLTDAQFAVDDELKILKHYAGRGCELMRSVGGRLGAE